MPAPRSLCLILTACVAGFAAALVVSEVRAQAGPAPAGPLTAVPQAPTEFMEVSRLVREGRPDAALDRADAALLLNPRDAQVRFARGVILADLKRNAEAITAFETLNQDFPELPEPYNNLAALHAAAGRYEQARTLLLQSLLAQPRYVTAHENLGDLYVAMAVQSYREATTLEPDNARMQTKLRLTRETEVQVHGNAAKPPKPVPSTDPR